jgi:isoleucyl-tRNA synthetase
MLLIVGNLQDHTKLSPLDIRNLARKTAEGAIKNQKSQFERLGIMADWNNPEATYRTLGRLEKLHS